MFFCQKSVCVTLFLIFAVVHGKVGPHRGVRGTVADRYRYGEVLVSVSVPVPVPVPVPVSYEQHLIRSLQSKSKSGNDSKSNSASKASSGSGSKTKSTAKSGSKADSRSKSKSKRSAANDFTRFPTFLPNTLVPTTLPGSPSGNPTMPPLTLPTTSPGSPSGSPTTAPTVTPGAPTVTPGAPTVTPGAPTVTPGAPTVTPGAPTVTPGAPTVTPGAPTVTPGAPTVTPGAPTVTPVDTPAPTFAPVRTATTGDCEFTVNLDLQIDFFEDELAACNTFQSEAEIWETIAGAITGAQANVGVDFQSGTVYFDEEQELGLFARRLQESTCSPRLDTETCDTNTFQQCRWGCLTAYGQGDACTTLTVDTFKQLEDEVTAALVSYINFKDELCLGEPNNLNVVIRAVEEPNDGDDAAPATRNEDLSNSLLGVNTAAQETTTDATSKTLTVGSELQFGFFAGKGREPTEEEIQALITETELFFAQEFQNDEAFAAVFEEFSIVGDVGTYDAANPDAFTLKFNSLIDVVLGSTATSEQAMNVMGASKFQDYIGRFVRQAEPVGWNEFVETHNVFFRGHATADGASRNL